MKWRSVVICPKISIFQLDNFVNIYWSKNEDRAVTSCFRSKTERELNATRKNNIVPGPGTYDLKLEVTTYAQLPAVKIRPFPNFFFKMKTERQMTMPFRKHCLTMSAPAMPMPPDPPSPGPGSYQIVDYKGPSKKFMSRKLVKFLRVLAQVLRLRFCIDQWQCGI